VAIGEHGRVEGELNAEHIVISGSFEGSIDARRLEIVAGGRVNGDITVAELVIEPGALFNGNSRIRDSQTEAQPAGDRKKAAPAAAKERKIQSSPEASNAASDAGP